MRPNLAVKFVIFLLTAVSLVIAAIGGIGILALESNGLYIGDLQTQQQRWLESAGNQIAWYYASRYAAETLGGCPETVLDYLFPETRYSVSSEYWNISVYQNGKLVDKSGPSIMGGIEKEYRVSVDYPIAQSGDSQPSQGDIPTTPLEETGSSLTAPTNPTAPLTPAGQFPEEEPLSIRHEWIWEQNKLTEYYLYFYSGPTYTVHLEFSPGTPMSDYQAILSQAYPYRYAFIAVLVSGLLLFAAGSVTLVYFAGRAKDGSLRLGGLNRVPLDLYAGFCGVVIYLMCVVITLLGQWSDHLSVAVLWLFALCGLVISLLLLALLYALSAQVKMGNLYWWHHSVIGCCLDRLAQGLRLAYKGVCALVRMIPVTWQWLLCAGALGMALSFFTLLAANGARYFLMYLLCLLVCAAVVLYIGFCLGSLLTGVKKMAGGDLNHKIPTKYLLGGFRDFAKELNSLSDTAKRSAQESLRSERMKTELITNVSHDIKTPLTSIINFVDLLQKPHTPEQEQQYLEVLSRQSSRMKKLIEDLIDLSKANTGNMQVNLQKMDIVEAVNQALGEFSDKLEASHLTPVFRQNPESIYVLADGRLTWRVIGNLLGNAEKYAMPGTRIYLDLTRAEGNVCLSMKNVSREELRINAKDLLERFVQGDASRSAGGSGLGLNIAKSLMEVQGGMLDLLLDGDLFKVTLVFPEA